ncbi:HlyC/CorC family transporter [Candidatus Micrarchaeota archaeon]|nr:HlyC/CorC family transporter [Candidatus Micrarchaeota archaeon]
MDPVEIVIMAVLIGFSAFFSSSEIALVSLSKTRVNAILDIDKSRAAEKLKYLKDHQDSTIIAILVGNNLVNVAASAIATNIALGIFGNAGIAVATGVMTLVLLTFGEITPKMFAVANAERLALFAATPLYYIRWVLYPVVWCFKKLSIAVRSKMVFASKYPKITEEELLSLVDLGAKEGEVSKVEREFAVNLFKFGDKTAKDVMVSREHIFAMPEDATIRDLIDEMARLKKTHTRVPIYEGDLDNITGKVYIKDLLDYVLRGDTGRTLKKMKRSIKFVLGNKRIDELFRELQEKRQHIAVVRDDRGLTMGVVTTEDIIEEVVGEIYDELEI